MKSIHPLNTETHSEVLKLNEEAQPAVTRLDSTELLRLTALSDAHLILVDSEDVVLGYMLAFYHDANYDGEEFRALQQIVPAPFLYIDQVVISAAVRHTGLGRALYDRMAAAAIRRGMYSLCCDVNTFPLNAASLAFHSRLGFERIDNITTTDGRQVALLKKLLQRQG